MASTKSSLFVTLMLFATLIETLPTGLAQTQIPFLGLEPSPSQFPSIQTLQECWVSMEEMVGCYTEAYRTFLTGNAGVTIGPSCCMAINDITSSCWSQMFPDTPSFPSFMNNYCSMYQNGQGDAPAPSMEPADD